MTTDWHRRAGTLPLDGLAMIGGERAPASDGATITIVSPIDGRHLGELAACGPADVDRAVRLARASFDDGVWSSRPPKQRGRILAILADLVEAHADELALMETLDTGKPIHESRTVDLPSSVACLRYFAGGADKLLGETVPAGGSARVFVDREPVGVVGAIVPWNFPLLLALWKIAPALAAGNSIVVKPAEQASLTVLRLAELASVAGVPPGVLSVLPGTGPVAGQALARHEDVDLVTFTGSTAVGRLVMSYAAESNLKRVCLELGGKSAQIVLADAPDLARVADGIVAGFCDNQGEVCSAGARLLVHESVQPQLLAHVLDRLRGRRPGDPLDPTTRLGALISAQHLERVCRRISAGVSDGARLLAGGTREREETGGWYVSPAVLDQVAPATSLFQEEIFGPVLAVTTFRDVSEAVKLANASTYGLASSVWSSDLDSVLRLTRGIRAGTVWVNCYDQSDNTVPFGGVRRSGFGRDKSMHALDQYTTLKTTWISLPDGRS